jgi:CDP-glycerol glycerophosphotransferase (TagB/SpsB family)
MLFKSLFPWITKNSVVGFVDYLVPKSKEIIVFSGNGLRGLNGSTLAVVRGWNRNPKTKMFKPYVLSLKKENFDGFKTINPYSIGGLSTLLRSYTVVITHGPGDLFWSSLCNTRERRIINLWHGMPLKKLGLWNWSESALISASDKEREILVRATGIDIKKIFATGYPRTDVLINDNERLKKTALNILHEKDTGQKWILYAPTHRKNLEGNGYMYKLKGFSFTDLVGILEKNNTNLLFRQHINDPIYEFPEHRRIFPVPFKKFNEIEPLYALADILITDYSSAVFDYVLLNRPVLGLASDLEEYRRHQGFLLDYESNFPGPVSYDWTELRRRIIRALKSLKSRSPIRDKIRRTFNKFTDGRSTDRVIDLICDLSIR